MVRARPRPFRLATSAFTLAVALFASPAWADRVVVLPLAGAGMTEGELERTRVEIAAAAAEAGHTLVSPTELAAALATVRDRVADTKDEHVAAGTAAQAVWSVGGRVDSRGHYRRVEIEVCQVKTGRVESLARNITSADERRKEREMLSLLLRPEGIANAPVPWENEPAPEPPPPAKVEPPPPPPPPKPAPPPPPPEPPAPPPPPYAEGRPLAVSLGGAVLAAVGRPQNASGSATTFALMGGVGYAFAAVPGLEVRGEIGGGVVAPRSVFASAGARYALVPHRIVYLGPELALGGFFPVGGDKKARFLMLGAPFVGFAIAPGFAAEAHADVAYAAGGTGGLTLVGGGARLVVRP